MSFEKGPLPRPIAVSLYRNTPRRFEKRHHQVYRCQSNQIRRVVLEAGALAALAAAPRLSTPDRS